MWLRSLDDMSVDQVIHGIDVFLRTSSEFPTPAALRKCCGAELDIEDREAIAWSKVREAIRVHGGYETVTFDDPLITATIRDMGGWVSLCDTPTEEMKWRYMKEFQPIYSAIAKTGIGDSSPLAGIHERTNEKLGYGPQAAPVRIETELPVHRVASRLHHQERPIAPRLDGPAAPVAGVLVDRMREAMEDKPEPVVKAEPRDPAAERARFLVAYPAASGKAAS